jgi:hypothetical protein
MALRLPCHPENDYVLGELRRRSAIDVEVILALGDDNRGSAGFQRRQDVVENHVISCRVASEKA